MNHSSIIYLDHQASTPLDPRVLEAMDPYVVGWFGNPHSADHVMGWQSAKAVDIASNQLARLIGSDPDEIIFTSGATEANNLALLGLSRGAVDESRNQILIGATEHKCVMEAARVIGKERRYEVRQIPVDEDGFVDIAFFANAVSEYTLVASVMAVNNEIGTIQNLGEISAICRQHGVILHTDAAQAPTAMDLSAIADQAHMVSLSAHKMYGPKGIGALYIRRDVQRLIEPLIYGGGQQNNLRSGTMPTPLCVGMGAAAEMLSDDEGLAERHRMKFLSDCFIDRLNSLPWSIAVNGPVGDLRHPGNLNVRFVGFAAAEILGGLQPKLAASTGSACTSGIAEPSHVLRAIGLSDEEAEASIRFSVGRNTSEQMIHEAAELIRNVLENLEAEGILDRSVGVATQAAE